MTQNRQPEGIPTGGQYAATAHSDTVEPLPQPPIDELGFDHNGGSFEIDRDGQGRYTIYAADDEGAEMGSFTFDGDPADETALKSAAATALVALQARLSAVATPGSRVLWTDPDGEEVHAGTVVTTKGEIITVALDSGGEAEVFAKELAAETAPAPAAGPWPFPHPDTRYPHPMESWPENVEAPESITLGEEDGTVDEVPRHTLHPDPQNARDIAQPSCAIRMANGASLTVVQVGDPEGGNTEERFEGDWEPYLKGDTYTRDQVIETAHETMLQARR